MVHTKYSEAITPARDQPFGIILTALAILIAALLFRIGLIGAPGMFDEYYHLLAARGWLETGRPTILDGEYTRTMQFTRAVAWLFSVTGSASMETGRLLALTAGVLIPPVLFLWLRGRAGWAAGLTAAGLAILWPQGIWESQFLRFYSWHCLSFLIGAIATFEAVQSRGLQRALWGAAATVAFVLALYLQVTTAIGLVAILAWAFLFLILPALWRHPRRWSLLGGLGAVAVAVLAFLVLSGTLEDLWKRYSFTPGWNIHRKDQATYYSNYLRNSYPVLWPLFPIAALVAYGRYPRITSFCTVVFAVILLAQSFGGMKALRYLSYGMPFFFLVFGLAAAAILPAAGNAVLRGADALNPTRFRWIAQGLAVLALLFALVVSPFFVSSLKAAAGRSVSPSGEFPPDWSRLPELLGDWQEAPFRLIFKHELPSIFALGDYDVLFAPSRISEMAGSSEFMLDPRTGRPVVADLETVAAILRCEPEGLLVTPSPPFWGGEDKEAWLPLFEAAGRTVETRHKYKLFALHWSGGTADAAACASLPQ